MASDVKWIKITTDIFDDEKVLMIESMPSADSIIVIWFKLLVLAGKQNNSGVFILNNRIAYTDEMLASIFRRDIGLVRMALRTFEQFDMIEIVDDVITIPNWGKHQTLDSYEKKKERDRIYQAKRRASQKRLIEKSSDTSIDRHADQSLPVAVSEEEREVDIEDSSSSLRSEELVASEPAATPPAERPAPIPYREIADLYNAACPNMPKCTALSEARKKAIRARYSSGYKLDDFRRLFAMAGESTFLNGGNNRNFMANFDWLIRDANMAKVLSGNYADRSGQGCAAEVPKRKSWAEVAAEMDAEEGRTT